MYQKNGETGKRTEEKWLGGICNECKVNLTRCPCG